MTSIIDRIRDLSSGYYGSTGFSELSKAQLRTFDREVTARVVRAALDSPSALGYKMLEECTGIVVYPRITLEIWSFICLYANHENTCVFAMRQLIKNKETPLEILLAVIIRHLGQQAEQRRIEYPRGLIGRGKTESELRDAIVNHPDFKMVDCLKIIKLGGGKLMHDWLSKQINSGIA